MKKKIKQKIANAQSKVYLSALKARLTSDTTRAEINFIASFRSQEAEARNALLFALQYSDSRGDENLSMQLLREAAEQFEDSDIWLAALAERYMRVGDFNHAIETIDTALKFNPNNQTAFINRVCWLAGHEGDSAKSKELFESWGQKFMDPLTDQSPPPQPTSRSLVKKINVGYVSGDFRNHSVRYFIEAYLRHHDRAEFVIHAFMTLPCDDVTEFIRPLVDHWHDVECLSDQDMHRLIRSENIDILIDLSGHTAGERLAVFARRAAPIQITWMGFMQTLGMKAMEWRISDYGATPPGSEAFYTEKLHHLDCMVTYTPPQHCEDQFEAPCLKNGHVTMICLNHSRKISDDILFLWKEILTTNKNAGLIIISSLELNGKGNDHQLEQRLKEALLPLEQVYISNRMSMSEFMRVASIADFALDTAPISGGTTTLHALWMGLPTLTMNKMSRGARNSATAGILLGVGLNECVAADETDYAYRAAEWINKPEKIIAMRKKCRKALIDSPLMDYSARVRELENCYRSLWRGYINQIAEAHSAS